MPATWYVLAADGETERLMKCTPKGHEALPLRPANDPGDGPDTSGPRFAPADNAREVPGSVPRATRTVNDLPTVDDPTERYLSRLGHAVGEAMAAHDEGPLYLAMDESRAALFETVGEQPVAGLVEPHATPRDLWELTRRLQD